MTYQYSDKDRTLCMNIVRDMDCCRTVGSGLGWEGWVAHPLPPFFRRHPFLYLGGPVTEKWNPTKKK